MLFTDKQRNIFEQLCKARERSILFVMTNFLKQRYTNVIQTPAYIIAEGTIPVALVAHADTVFKSPPKKFFYDTKENVMWSPDGLGADDRAGIFSIFNIVKTTEYRPHIIITTGEESGCIGAAKLLGHYPKFPFPLNFLIQLDRRGEKDSVYYDCGNDIFEQYINQFGFVTEWGSFTDISVLAPVWKVAAVNFSVGYFDEHSIAERLYVDYLFNTIDKVKNILDNVQNNKRMIPFEYIDISKMTGYDYPYEWEEDYGYGQYHNVTRYCHDCGKYLMPTSNIPIFCEGENNTYYKEYLCLDCFSKISHTIKYCDKCKTAWRPLINVDGQNWTCPECKRVEDQLIDGNARLEKPNTAEI